MCSIIRNILAAMLLLVLLPVANAQKADTTYRHPVWTIEAGYNLPEFYNQGFEVNAGYYPYHNKWLRIGPSVQTAFFFVPNKQWFPQNRNTDKATFVESRINLLVNFEFLPAKKNTFFIGIAPYIGYFNVLNKGRVINRNIDLDVSYQYTYNAFDWGLRTKLGGYMGRKKLFGLQGQFQFSMAGIADDDPRSKLFNVGVVDYKSFVGLTFMYKIK